MGLIPPIGEAEIQKVIYNGSSRLLQNQEQLEAETQQEELCLIAPVAQLVGNLPSKQDDASSSLVRCSKDNHGRILAFMQEVYGLGGGKERIC